MQDKILQSLRSFRMTKPNRGVYPAKKEPIKLPGFFEYPGPPTSRGYRPYCALMIERARGAIKRYSLSEQLSYTSGP